MTNNITQLKIGSRESRLALTQTELVIKALEKIPEIRKKFSFKVIKIKTQGDIDKSKILNSGYKGFFTNKIDDCLLKNKIDIAVHSAKDIPSKLSQGINISAFLKREDPRDILLSNKNYSFQNIPSNMVIGTSSIRRKKQIHHLRPDLKIKFLRGNIETRIKKMKTNNYDGIILAVAGLKRLKLNYKNKNILNSSLFIPAGSQGAIAITTRKQDVTTSTLIRKINHDKTEIEVKTERKFLEKINADCNSPVGAYAKVIKSSILFSVTVPYQNDEDMFTVKRQGSYKNPEILGIKVAQVLKKKFGTNFLKKNHSSKKIIFLLTRPFAQSNELKKKLNISGCDFINCPMLSIRSFKLTKDQIKQIQNADGIIFTSANAVIFSQKYLKKFSNKIYCVGKDTKSVCLKNKMKNVYCSNSDVNGLIKLVAKKFHNKKKKLIYISAKETTKDLNSILKRKGFNTTKIIIYETKKVKFIEKSILDLIRLKQLNFITFFSKKTVQSFTSLVLKYKLKKYLTNIECISLSKEIEKYAKKNNFKNYYISSKPDRANFLKLIHSLYKRIKLPLQ